MKKLNSKLIPISFSALLLALLFSCTKRETTASFYYWQTNFSLNQIEKQALSELHCQEVYVRLFDIDIKNDSIVPLGVIKNLDSFPSNLQLIPVVFITNRTFIETKPENIKHLAVNTHNKITSLLKLANKTCKKIQIDCDWSQGTKHNYFQFLKQFKAIDTNIILSSTIRLHQVKYPTITGIPPVDEGTIMYYNMGKLKGSENSIYNSNDANKYIESIAYYPLKCNIALPIFSWGKVERESKIINLINNTDSLLFEKKEQLLQLDSITYKVKSSFLYKGIYFKENDVMKMEQTSVDELMLAAKGLAENLKQDSIKIIFFDLNSTNLNYYSNEKLKDILNAFN
ncbi:MAG: hypothetical protein IPG89_06585 [Bacteroidetes bacterium]|nr:hypothetical protein [Bacteroidota bacterium]